MPWWLISKEFKDLSPRFLNNYGRSICVLCETVKLIRGKLELVQMDSNKVCAIRACIVHVINLIKEKVGADLSLILGRLRNATKNGATHRCVAPILVCVWAPLLLGSNISEYGCNMSLRRTECVVFVSRHRRTPHLFRSWLSFLFKNTRHKDLT